MSAGGSRLYYAGDNNLVFIFAWIEYQGLITAIRGVFLIERLMAVIDFESHRCQASIQEPPALIVMSLGEVPTPGFMAVAGLS